MTIKRPPTNIGEANSRTILAFKIIPYFIPYQKNQQFYRFIFGGISPAWFGDISGFT